MYFKDILNLLEENNKFDKLYFNYLLSRKHITECVVYGNKTRYRKTLPTTFFKIYFLIVILINKNYEKAKLFNGEYLTLVLINFMNRNNFVLISE